MVLALGGVRADKSCYAEALRLLRGGDVDGHGRISGHDIKLFGLPRRGLDRPGYFLNQKGRLRSEDWRFPAMNLLGSVLVIVSLFYHPNLPSAAIEVFWSLISIYGIRKNLRARQLPV